MNEKIDLACEGSSLHNTPQRNNNNIGQILLLFCWIQKNDRRVWVWCVIRCVVRCVFWCVVRCVIASSCLDYLKNVVNISLPRKNIFDITHLKKLRCANIAIDGNEQIMRNLDVLECRVLILYMVGPI